MEGCCPPGTQRRPSEMRGTGDKSPKGGDDAVLAGQPPLLAGC